MTHKVTCTEYQAWLVEALAKGLSDEGLDNVRNHAATCSECLTASAEIRESWEAFGQAQSLEPPRAIRERAHGAVLKLMAEETA